jgi:hypothetical protein
MTMALTVAGLAVLLLAALIAVKGWAKWRGARLITCPENQQPAGVRVDAWHAAFHVAPGVRLNDCSRWPDKKDCGQECLRQIENSPDGCLVRGILERWYAGKDCVYCGAPLEHIEWLERKPALMAPDGRTIEWQEVRPEQVPDVLATHRAVCWNCHVVEGFRREHPELVVERPR